MNIFIKILFFLLLYISIHGQNFISEQLISIPGKNINFDIIVHEYDDIVYISWENKNNSVYTIFFKQIKPQILDNILIVQDTIPCINPTLSFISDNETKSILGIGLKLSTHSLTLNFNTLKSELK